MASAAIYCMPVLANLPSLTEAQVVQSVRETVKRRLSHNVNKKEPLDFRHVIGIAKMMAQPSSPMIDILTATAIIAFGGFLRFSYLVTIFVDWITFREGLMEINLPGEEKERSIP